jgi:hypothetical protein
MKTSAIILLVCVLGMSAMTSRAQINILPREALEAVDSPRLSGDSSSLSFDKRHITADPMKEDDPPKTFRFEMTNSGDRPLNVMRIQTTCSCVSATTSQNQLNPGEKATVTVRYNPRGHWGRFEHKVFIYTQPGNAPAAVLKLTLDVASASDKTGMYQVHMGFIGLRTSEVVFRKGTPAVENLNFINMGPDPLTLECEKMFLPACMKFETRPETVAAGEEGVMVISYEPTGEQERDHVPLILKGLGTTPGKSTIKIRFE